MSDWYDEGLRFECTRCGDCCRGEPGYVWVTLKEAQAIAAAVGMGMRDFEASCLRSVGRRMSLVEKPNGDCIFWQDGGGCKVYDVRPLQCRTFPFWPEVVRSAQDWKRESQRCRGIGAGKLYSAEHVRRQLEKRS